MPRISALLSALVLSTLLSPSRTEAQTRRVGVIAVGEDALAAGALQQRAERALSKSGIAVVPTEELALRLATQPGARDAGRLAALFAQAKEGYFADRLVEAMERVNEAARTIDAGLGVPGYDRVTVLTWRAALYLAMKDQTRAEEQGRALLALAPGTNPDLSIFRPSFRRFIDELRPKLPGAVEVKLEGAPAGARLEVDGRLVETRFRIGPGKHTLSMSAPGYRFARVAFQASSDLLLATPPALDPGSELQAALQTAVSRGGSGESLADVSNTLSVDALVVVSGDPRSSFRSAMRGPDGRMRRSEEFRGREADTQFAQWVASGLGIGGDATAAGPASGRPTSTPRARVEGAGAFAISLDAGLSTSFRDRSLAGADGPSIDTAFAGVGGFVDAAAWHRAWLAGLRASWTTYAVSLARFELPDGSKASVVGGQTLRADVRAGRRLLGRGDGFSLLAQLEAVFESHQAEDLRGPGGDLGLFASYTRFAAGVGVDASMSLGAVRVHAGGSVHPLHRWSEGAAKTGDAPVAAPAIGFRAGAGLPLSDAWLLRTEYRGELRRVAFEGTNEAPLDPPITDARITDDVHAITLTVHRAF